MRRCSHLFALSSVLMCVSHVVAQESMTTDGRTVTHGPGTSGPAITMHPQAVSSELADSEGGATRVVLNFDTVPGSPWETFTCTGGPSMATASHGILTLDSGSCLELSLESPNGLWHRYVDRPFRSATIAARCRSGPTTTPTW
jgi:hypothetical protein